MENIITSPVKKDIRNILKVIDELPTLPNVMYEVTHMINRKNANVSDVTNIISQDPSITAKILKIVNSAYFGFPRKITTINHALVIIGFNDIKNLLLSTSVFNLFSAEGNKNMDKFNMVDFWKHCIGCGAAARMLANSFKYRISGELFVAGLLHDVGKLVFNQHMHEEFINAIELAALKNIPLCEAERMVVGYTHSQIGGMLLERWHLPAHLIEAAAYHHEPVKAKINPDITAIIHLADILCRKKEIGFSGDNSNYDISPYAWEILKKKKLDLNSTDIDKFLFDLDGEIEKSSAFMSLIGARA